MTTDYKENKGLVRGITRADVRKACNIATGGSKTPEELDKLTDKVMLRIQIEEAAAGE